MDPVVAAQLSALRSALESLIVRVTKSPDSLLEMSQLDSELVALVSSLANVDSATYNYGSSNDT